MSTARDSGDGEATAGVRAAVVGAGITGLFTALRLAEVGCSVTVFSDHKDTQTMTSLAAGAVWFPYELGETPTEVVQQVSVRTAEWGLQVVADGLGDTAGVAVMPATQLFGTVEEAAAACRAYQFTTIGPCRMLSAEELPDNEPRIRAGIAYPVLMFNPPLLLAFLTRRCMAKGCQFVQRHVTCVLRDTDGAAVVVNCAGLEGHRLHHPEDPQPYRSMVAGRGQVLQVRVKAPAPPCTVCVDDDTEVRYILPRPHCPRGTVIMGGSYDAMAPDASGKFSTAPDAELSGRILTGCARLLGRPEKDFEVMRTVVGLRPVRPAGLCISGAVVGASGRVIVHNYGVGGCGYTVGWGCADLVAQVAAQLLPCAQSNRPATAEVCVDKATHAVGIDVQRLPRSSL